MQEAPKIGQIITEPVGRDAVHVAIAPVTAGEDLDPGWRIKITNNVAMSNNISPDGIVDPFLTEMVEAGQKFYVFLMPGSVTGLRHVYTHPAFKTTPPEAKI